MENKNNIFPYLKKFKSVLKSKTTPLEIFIGLSGVRTRPVRFKIIIRKKLIFYDYHLLNINNLM